VLQNEKRNRRTKRAATKNSKFCGASSNSNTICINVHNRHDFYFIVSPSSQITSIITTAKRKKTSKISYYRHNYQQTLVAPSVSFSQPSRRCCAAWEKLLVNYVKVAQYDYYASAIYLYSILALSPSSEVMICSVFASARADNARASQDVFFMYTKQACSADDGGNSSSNGVVGGVVKSFGFILVPFHHDEFNYY